MENELNRTKLVQP